MPSVVKAEDLRTKLQPMANTISKDCGIKTLKDLEKAINSLIKSDEERSYLKYHVVFARAESYHKLSLQPLVDFMKEAQKSESDTMRVLEGEKGEEEEDYKEE